MPQDHQLTFDWILYAILVPPVLLALWDLMTNWKFAAGDRKALERQYGWDENRNATRPPAPRAKMEAPNDRLK